MPLPYLELKSKMVLKSVKANRIANKLGVTNASVSMVVRGHSRSRNIEIEIANRLGMKREDIFPVIPQHPDLAA